MTTIATENPVTQAKPEPASVQPRSQPKQPLAATTAGKSILGVSGVVITLLLWEALTRTEVVPSNAIPPASHVLGAFANQLGEAAFWAALWQTVSVALLGLLLIVAISVPLALAIGLIKPFAESTWFLIEFLKPIPPIALIPLGLLLWGPSPGMKLFLIVLGAVWPLLTQLIYGVREVNGVAVDMARSYRLGWRLTTTRVVLPSIMPFAFTGMRISAAIAIIIAVVTEMIGGAAGIGQDIVVAQSAGALTDMYALVLTAGLLGLLINFGFRAAEKPVLFWHPSVRGENS